MHKLSIWVAGLLASVNTAISMDSVANNNVGYDGHANQSEHNWRRDPFTPSALMYERIEAQDGRIGSAYGFVPSSENNRIPRMKLRGLLNNEVDEFIALLEVQGVGVFMVREGDEFNIDPSQPKTAIRISEITRLSITVETGRLGSIRVLR